MGVYQGEACLVFAIRSIGSLPIVGKLVSPHGTLCNRVVLSGFGWFLAEARGCFFVCVCVVEAARAHGLIEHQSGSARRSVRVLILVMRAHLIGAVSLQVVLFFSVGLLFGGDRSSRGQTRL